MDRQDGRNEAKTVPVDPPMADATRAAAALSRRQFMLATALASSTLLLGTRAQAFTSQLEAYSAANSVLQGGTLAFHVRNPGGSLTVGLEAAVSIVRIGYPDVEMHVDSVAVSNQAVPDDAYAAGCGWPVSYLLQVGSDWPSGIYLARFGTDWAMTEVPFVVRPGDPAANGRMLVQVQFTTMQAYNPWGGKSLYDYNSTGGVRSCRVSLNRPMTLNIYENGADPWYPVFVRWLEKNGIPVDFCTSLDLHREASLLAPYRLFITVGHDEYWSRSMRQHLDSFVWAGGNVISMSGNTCWWQIRVDPDSDGNLDRTLVCYKSTAEDPLQDATLKTVNWIDLAPSWPENATLGLGFTHGAIWANDQPRPSTPFLVMQPEHWAFAGTGLAERAEFGADVVGYETDAVDVDWGADGRLYPTGLDGAPRNMKILAVADATNWAAQAAALGVDAQSGLAVIGVYTQGGTVFSVGCTDWVHGLGPEMLGQTPSPISRITLNAIQRLAAPDPDASLQPVDVLGYHQAQASGDGTRYFYTTSAFVDPGWIYDGVAFRGIGALVAETVPVYQYHADQADGDGQRHTYALDDAIGNGWTLDGVAFHAFAESRPGTVAVYQYHAAQTNGDGWRFLFSTDPGITNGWTMDGPVFFTAA